MRKLLTGLTLCFAASTVYAVDGAAVYNTGQPLSCAYCHGKDGAGYPKTDKSRKVPAVAGLPSKTTEVFLRATKSGYVKNGIKRMHERANKLSDDEIVAVAKYIEAMHKQLDKD